MALPLPCPVGFPRQRPTGSRAIRAGDLEEEFKKRALGMFSDSSSGGLSQERLKVRADTSAAKYRQAMGLFSRQESAASVSPISLVFPPQELNASRLGGPAGDLSSRGDGPAADPQAQHPQQGGLQPPHPDSSSQQRADDPTGAFSTHLPLSHEPYHPLEFYPTSQFELDWGAPGAGAEPWLGPGTGDRSRCFVILFGVGRAETEGIYSLRAVAKVGRRRGRGGCWHGGSRAWVRASCVSSFRRAGSARRAAASLPT